MQQFIDGIHNYCDRWCERCRLRRQCQSYALSPKLSTVQREYHQRVLWQYIAANFGRAVASVQSDRTYAEANLNLFTAAEEAAAYMGQPMEQENHHGSLYHICSQYRHIALPLLEKSEALVSTTRRIIQHIHLGIADETDASLLVADMGECLQVIHWYVFLIDAKVQRAAVAKEFTESGRVDPQADADGSAHVALLGIEQSLTAWERLMQLSPDNEDTAIEALAVLQRLRREVLLAFPGALHFRRPGFDELP